MRNKFFFFFWFLVELEGLNLYLNNEYQESFSDGSDEFPFKSFSEAFLSSNIEKYQNETIIYEILSNNLAYKVNNTILIQENINVCFKSAKNEKAKLQILSEGGFFILCKLIIF